MARPERLACRVLRAQLDPLAQLAAARLAQAVHLDRLAQLAFRAQLGQRAQLERELPAQLVLPERPAQQGLPGQQEQAQRAQPEHRGPQAPLAV